MSARSVTATLINKTNQSLTLIGSKLVHGTWSENQTPPSEIPAGGQGNWMAESNGFATGVEGTVTYLAGNVGRRATSTTRTSARTATAVRRRTGSSSRWSARAATTRPSPTP